MKLVEVLLPLPIRKIFNYSCNNNYLIKGNIVKVPFRNRTFYGVIKSSFNETIEAESNIKAIISSTNYLLKDELMNFIQFVSNYTTIPEGMILKMVLSSPKAFEDLKPKKVTHQFNENNQIEVDLNNEQINALNKLVNYAEDGFNVSVLKGVTGSGKTEVYLELAKYIVSKGKQVLILLPEILLATQLVDRFKQRLNFEIHEWHSSLTPLKKARTWQKIFKNEVKLIVGARSSLFLPFADLGLIILDEEHENAFKQEESGCYHARDMAIARAKLNNISIVLCSATPSMETEYNLKLGKYHQILLKNRYQNASLPNINIIDLIKHKPKGNNWITQLLRDKMIENLNGKKQALIYLNRRGYSVLTLCNKCRTKVICPKCDFNLVKHKSKKILMCHYCGYSEPEQLKCKVCNSQDRFSNMGPGVERLADEIKEFLPDARVSILSSDTMSTKNKASVTIDAIKNLEIDIIIGTQMVIKGLHFPKLDLVGVIDADLSLYTADIRAVERTYQILKQVAGRAGRESGLGNVYLQTIEPNSYLIKCLKEGNWNDFIISELRNRQIANVPPFTRAIMVLISGKNHEEIVSFNNKLSRIVPLHHGIKFLGPTAAPLFRLKDKFRYRFIIIASKNVNVQKITMQWLNELTIPKGIQIKVDVDPLSFS